jgi:hypothetical protein
MDYTRKFDSMSEPRAIKNASKIIAITEEKDEEE